MFLYRKSSVKVGFSLKVTILEIFTDATLSGRPCILLRDAHCLRPNVSRCLHSAIPSVPARGHGRHIRGCVRDPCDQRRGRGGRCDRCGPRGRRGRGRAAHRGGCDCVGDCGCDKKYNNTEWTRKT